ncbi:MAG: GNAT family N-acetyltransferase [Rhizobium sp.]
MQVDVIETLEDLRSLKDEWSRIYEIDPEAHAFLSWTWISSWFASRALPWFVLAARAEADGPPVAFFPIQLGTGFERGRGFYNVVVTGGSYFAPNTGILCDPAFVETAVPAFAAHLRSLAWRSLHLDDIDRSSERIGLFLKQFPSSDFNGERIKRRPDDPEAAGKIDPEIHVHATLPAEFSSFVTEKLHRHARRNIRRCLRDLDGSARLRVTHGGSETAVEDLEALLSLWEKQWAWRGPNYLRYTLESARAVLPDCVRSGDLLLPILWQDETPIAAAAILVDHPRKRLSVFLSARDASVRDMSPGLTLHAHTVRWAIENGFRIYDLGPGDYAHKYLFGSVSHRVERYRIDTRTGRNLGERLDPHCLSIVLARVKSLQAAGDLSDAEIGCRQILAVVPDHAGALALYREIVASRTLWQAIAPDQSVSAKATDQQAVERAEAEKQCRAAIADNPADFDAVYRLGILLMLRGEARDAEVEITRALELRPDAAAVHCTHGNILAYFRDFEGAIVRYDRTIALDPNHAVAHNNKGNALRHLGRPDEALASYERALAIRPDYQQALANRASLFDAEEDILPPISQVSRLPLNV